MISTRDFSIIKSTIKHTDWFISGSSANPNIPTANDIDIYFYSIDAYNDAKSCLPTFTPNINAITCFIDGIDKPIQFIHKFTGTPDEIFDTMDLNICKHAILSNNTYISHPSANEEITLTNPSASSFNRYFKYLNIYYPSIATRQKYTKKLIDRYITDTTELTSYYENNHVGIPANILLYKAAVKEYFIKDYLKDQTLLRAPELLL